MIKIVTRSLSNHASTYLQWDLKIFGFLQFFSFTLQKLCLLAANFGKNRIVSYRCSIWIWNFVFWVKKMFYIVFWLSSMVLPYIDEINQIQKYFIMHRRPKSFVFPFDPQIIGNAFCKMWIGLKGVWLNESYINN